ncbi:MAG: triose-phosphate isomerase [Bacteroidia bacterium]|nr:triose-phosphate isomerase [Bacteroidia bacterium]
MSRKKIAAGNWKMNLTAVEAQSLASEVIHIVRTEYLGGAEVVLAPPFPFLGMIQHLTKDFPGFYTSAQNLHQAQSGAYTGEVSASMLTSIGVTHTIIGHSERRQLFGETNALLASKTDQALAHGLTPIFCIGETLSEREAGQTFAVNETQLREGLFHLDASAFSKIVIAYEPVWAIGTGKTATPEQAQEVHAHIRSLITAQYGAAVADATSILYGGSVKADNAASLFSQPDIDGGLVGGASLKAREFAEIVKALA